MLLVLAYAGLTFADKKLTDMASDVDMYNAALELAGIEPVEQPVILRVPAIPRCPKRYTFENQYGYCFKYKGDKDIDPICKPCASPDQTLKGSSCVGRRYSKKTLSCNAKGDPERNKDFVVNEDGLCIRAQVYVPHTYCPPGFAKKFIRNERVCKKVEEFDPDIVCETEDGKKLTPSEDGSRCYDYAYTNLVTRPITSRDSFECPPGYSVRGRQLDLDGNPIVDAPLLYELDFARVNIVPEAADVELTCVASVLSNVTPRAVCPARSKRQANGRCKRLLVSQRLVPPVCKHGWYFNPNSQVCQTAEVFMPYVVCAKPFSDWPGSTADTACAEEKKVIADCECPAGTVNRPAHRDYPRLATKRKEKKCAHVYQVLPKFSCEHVPGYQLTPDRMCETRMLPSQIVAPRARQRYALKEWAVKRDERRALARARISARLNNKYTRISIPDEMIIQSHPIDYGPIKSCLTIANRTTLEIPKNPDGLPMACSDEAALAREARRRAALLEQQEKAAAVFDSHYLGLTDWSTRTGAVDVTESSITVGRASGGVSSMVVDGVAIPILQFEDDETADRFAEFAVDTTKMFEAKTEITYSDLMNILSAGQTSMPTAASTTETAEVDNVDALVYEVANGHVLLSDNALYPELYAADPADIGSTTLATGLNSAVGSNLAPESSRSRF